MIPNELKVTEKQNSVSINIWQREYSLDNHALFTSLKTQGRELLASPVRIVSKENGKESQWGAHCRQPYKFLRASDWGYNRI